MQQKNERRSNTARSRDTRDGLVAAARALFIKKGYAETSTPEIAKAANITRGALYHHFKDKADLFRAVVRAEYQAVRDEIGESAAQHPINAVDALILGSRGYLNAMCKEGRTRLMLLDAPAVLGRLEMDIIDQETSAGALKLGLKEAMERGEIMSLPLDALTVQLSAMFDRAALGIAEGDDPDEYMTVFEAIFPALK